ncbi:MAG: hypothetical protein DSY43_05820 [Gammaproteobacteria bacterium]|nr:MAG: hypothetical protein DSY43_05820 [Gammaproteobacteria bacterium]
MKEIIKIIFIGSFLITRVFSAELNVNNFSINSSVATLMGWYSRLLSENSQGEFVDYYPKRIQQIKIIKVNFINSKRINEHKFDVKLLLTYKNADKLIGKVINETLVFSLSPSNKAKLSNIIKGSKTFMAPSSGKGFSRLYYQKRHFIYAWLAWLDGEQSRLPIVEDGATYIVDIAGKHIQGNVFSSLKKRGQYLYKGKHLLHSMDIKALGNNRFAFNIIIEYNGVNVKNKKVIAKI